MLPTEEMVERKRLRLQEQVEGDAVEKKVRPDQLPEIEERQGHVEETDEHSQAHLEAEDDEQPYDRFDDSGAESDEERIRRKKPMELIQMPRVDDRDC